MSETHFCIFAVTKFLSVTLYLNDKHIRDYLGAPSNEAELGIPLHSVKIGNDDVDMFLFCFFLISSKSHISTTSDIRYQSCNWIRSHNNISIRPWVERSRDYLVTCTRRLKPLFDCCHITNFGRLNHFFNSKNAEADRDCTTEVAYLCIKTCKTKLIRWNFGSYRSSTN